MPGDDVFVRKLLGADFWEAIAAGAAPPPTSELARVARHRLLAGIRRARLDPPRLAGIRRARRTLPSREQRPAASIDYAAGALTFEREIEADELARFRIDGRAAIVSGGAGDLRNMDTIDWLLDADPAIRWQTLRDLTDSSPEGVAAERAKVGTTGWGAALLGVSIPDNGTEAPWNNPANPEWLCLTVLGWLRDIGLDPQAAETRRFVSAVRDKVIWQWWDERPFFHGEVEPCINGRVLALAAYFGQESGDLVDRLLGGQMDDGGWNCESENGSTRGSFNSTIDVLEGLRAHEEAVGGNDTIRLARERGQEYLLERRLLRRLSTGEMIDPAFSEFAFPPGYRYDILRALDYFRIAASGPDDRTSEAIAAVESKRRPDGTWNLDTPGPDDIGIDNGEQVGQPSRWITLRALRVLRWARPARDQPRLSGAA